MILKTARVLRAAASVLESIGASREIRRAPVATSEAYDFIASFRYGGVQPAPFQVRDEIIRFLEHLAQRPPRTIVELGTARGGTLFLLTRVAAPDAILVSVDLPGGRFGGGYARSYEVFLRSLGRERQKVRLIRGDTHMPATLERVTEAVDGSTDLLFIDGDHTAEGVRADYEMYAPLVRRGGIVAFHDIVDGPPDAVGGVPSFWRQIRTSESEEIVADWGQGGYGIGLLHRP